MDNLVTIIVPVYNVKEYLLECIESILVQTYKNLEIILVDDGSDDGSGLICDEYAIKDSRIVVIHQKNQGLSAARNAGLAILKGKYVYFLDSDDYIAHNTIEILLSKLLMSNSDISVGKFKSFIKSDKQCTIEKSIDIVFDTENCLKNMLLNNGIGHEACGKLFSVYLWKNYKFPVGKLYEDYATIYYVVAGAKKIILCSNAFYYYRFRSGSIMNTEIKEDNFMLLDISDDVTNRLIAMNENLREAAIRSNVVTYLKFLKRILDVGINSYPVVQQRIVSNVKKHKIEFLESNLVRTSDKLKLYSLLIGKIPFYLMYCLADIINKYFRK